MKWSSFKYLTKQGWHSMIANRLMTLASVGVLTACLLITGIAVLLSVNVNSFVDTLSAQNVVEFYLEESLTQEAIDSLNATVSQIDNVHGCTIITKEQAVEEMKDVLGDYADLLHEYEGAGNLANPFPASLRVTMTDLALLDATVAQVVSVGGEAITDYESPSDLSSILVSMRRIVTYIGWGLVAILGVVSVVVISNTIRLTVFARRREINIMKFVGATNSFIRLPFFVEGVTVGAISGMLAAGLVCSGYAMLLHYVKEPSVSILGEVTRAMLPLQTVWAPLLLVFVLFGALLGGVGCATSIKKHLKV